MLRFICILFLATVQSLSAQNPARPNVLFIAIDDLNDWVGMLEGHPQARTPRMDRLASRGVLFTNAHCQAPICQPSRTSLLTGTYPFSNGVYDVEQNMRDAPLVQEAVTIPQYFREQGYHSLAAGKIHHRTPEEEGSWDEFGGRSGWTWMRDLVGKEGVSGLPEPSIFDFGPIEVDEKEMNDMKVTDWVAKQLERDFDKPFFLSMMRREVVATRNSQSRSIKLFAGNFERCDPGGIGLLGKHHQVA
jgi:arylsulfatase A-like enzyme